MTKFTEETMNSTDISSDDEEVSDKNPNKRLPTGTNNKPARKKAKKELYKPPTADELNRLKETENLFNSNLFRLQIDELLTEVNVKSKHKSQFEVWYQKFQKLIESLPEYKEVLLSKLQKKDVATGKRQQFVNDLVDMRTLTIKCDQDVSIKFERPESCDLFGLFKIGACLGPNLCVCINLRMPKSGFHEKDYLNNRYFVKRYHYLLYVARHLQKSDICANVSYKLVNSNELLPILIVTPDIAKKIAVEIYVTPNDSSFKPSRCLPDKNNLKTSLFNDNSITDDLLKDHGTPYYNSLMLHDFTLSSNERFVEETLGELRNVQDGIRLLLIWSRQRELGKDFFGFTDGLIVNVLTYLVTKRKVNKHMSSYQVVRNFWVFLAHSDWCTSPVSVSDDVKLEVFEEFKKNFEVVFVDKSGCYNLAGFLSADFYLRVKHEAQLAVKFLDEAKFSSFSSLFMLKLPFHVQYDALLRFKLPQNKQFIKSVSVADRCKFAGCSDLLALKHITTTLKTGLNKRVNYIIPHCNAPERKFTFDEPPEKNLDLIFGLSLNIEHAFNVLELGPHPHDPKAKEFLQFWGKWSNLRRFPDGTICEAVYFETHTLQERRQIVKKILSFLAAEKLKLDHEIWYDQFEDVLKIENLEAPFPTGTNEEGSLKVIAVADELSKILRGLELPLEVTSVIGNADVFSFTEVFPPIPTNYKWGKHVQGDNIVFRDSKMSRTPPYVAPIECVIHLSLHSKWPNDLEAIRHIKTAVYLKIAELLSNQFDIKSNVRPEHLDVFYGGLLFRYRLYHPKEVSYLKKNVTSEGLTSFKDTEQSVRLETCLNLLPKVTGALRGIQSQYPSFGPSTALIKRWLRSQLIDDFHVSDVVINLLNAACFLNGEPLAAPHLPQVAFVRFLKFLCETDWNLQPVVANFNDELTREKLDEIETSFNHNRQNYPSLFLVTPYDEGKSVFTKSSPTKEVLRRVGLLAGQCFAVIGGSFEKKVLEDVTPLFKANLEGYDVLIRLNDFYNPRRRQNLSNTQNDKLCLEEYNVKKSPKIPIVDFNPIAIYLNELRKHYGQHGLFFHDTYGGNVIGVLWYPKSKEEKEFKISQADGCKLVDGKLVTHFEAIFEDFAVLGKGLIKNIEIK